MMRAKNWQVLLTVLLAFVFWYVSFRVKLLNFWLSMSLAVAVLTTLSAFFAGLALKKEDVTAKGFVVGVLSAVVLYGVFFAGNYLSQLMFSFARPEVHAIYGIRSEGEAAVIALVLFFVTSPGEEMFWRGFLQRWAMDRLGGPGGWLAAALVYAAVHIPSGNVMLVMAALVAGLFWGALYWRTGNIFACIVSHAFWTVGIFVLWPIL
jgi:hypothetical protein